MAFGAALSFLSVPAAGAVGVLLLATLGRDGVGDSAGAALLSAREPWLFVSAVLIVPAIETLACQLLPIEMLRRFKAPAVLSIAVSALLFGLGHAVNGGVGHGLTSFTAGVFFATAYCAFRTRSLAHAMACAWSCHASHNFLFLYGIAPASAWLGVSGDV